MRPMFNLFLRAANLLFLFTIIRAHATTLFADDFNDGNANGWVVAQDESGAPVWQVINGAYREAGAIRNYAQSFHIGTYAYYSNGLDFTNYEVTVRLTPITFNSVGVMFRYKDSRNYYRFSINASQGFSRLEKKVNGVFKTLAFNGIGPKINVDHLVTVDARGPSIFVYLDGEPLFGAHDSGLTSGTVALFTQGDATFDNVSVTTSDAASQFILSKPVSYSVDTSSSLAVAAVAKGAPAGGGVRFTLDNGATFTDKAPPYAGTFFNVPLGNHSVAAAIVDGSGQPLPHALARDTKVVVGVGGKYFVAMGDSITMGFDDNIFLDDASADGSNVNRGYDPILNNKLSAQLGRLRSSMKALAARRRAQVALAVRTELSPPSLDTPDPSTG